MLMTLNQWFTIELDLKNGLKYVLCTNGSRERENKRIGMTKRGKRCSWKPLWTTILQTTYGIRLVQSINGTHSTINSSYLLQPANSL